MRQGRRLGYSPGSLVYRIGATRMNEAMHAAHAARVSRPGLEGAFPWGPDDEEARRTRLRRRGAWLHRPGRELYLGRDEEGRLAGVTIFDLLGHVKLQGTAEEAAAWVGSGCRRNPTIARPGGPSCWRSCSCAN